ncbi:L-2-amino-thiazoline-4-carboxylic acid hydrolase [Bacteroidota bacterium]
MEKNNIIDNSRRDFIGKIIPGCALFCLGSQHLLASSLDAEVSPLQQDKHKFNKIRDAKITHKQWEQQKHVKYIGILKQLEKNIGKEKLYDMLKKASYADNVELGKRLSGRIKSLKVFAGPFRNENSGIANTMIREIVEDNDEAFEIRITECLAQVIYKEANAEELGYACVCHADFGLPAGLNPKLKLIRTKTLMQGHDCCNHRYVWEK